PAEAQPEIFRWLAAQGLLAVTPTASFEPVKLSPGSVSPAAPSHHMVTQLWQLRNLTSRDFEARLVRTWGASLQSSQDAVGEVATFRFGTNSATATSIVVDRRANTATISSPQATAATWLRLVSMLDARPATADERISVLPVAKADPSTIRKAVGLMQQA